MLGGIACEVSKLSQVLICALELFVIIIGLVDGFVSLLRDLAGTKVGGGIQGVLGFLQVV